MKKLLLLGAVLAGGFLILLLILGVYGVSTFNQAKTLNRQYESYLKANEARFDNVWKTISQAAQVPEAQKEAFRQIFTDYAAARTGNGDVGAVMRWIKEAVPTVDLSIYKNLQNIIVGSRAEWTANQVTLVSIANEYNLLLDKFPSNILLGAFGFKRIDPKVITSTRTERAFETGKDDDVTLPLGKH